MSLSLAATIVLGAGEPAVVIKRDQPWQLVSFAEDAGLGRRYIYGLEFDADGTVWVAATDGLRRYDGYRWTKFTAAEGLPSSFVRSVFRAQGGALWVGTDKGAGVFNPFGKTFDRRGSELGLAGPGVRRICQDPDGTLWFCCDRWPDVQQPGGLSSWRDGIWRTYTVADGLAADHVLNYLLDSHGDVWSAPGEGLVQVTDTGQVVHPYEKTGLSVLEGHQADAQGVSWFYGQTATGVAALACLIGTNWEPIPLPATLNQRIISAAADSERGLWLVLAVADLSDYALAYADRRQVTTITLGTNKPPVINPRLCADKQWIWMYGFTGLYRAPRTEPARWSKVEELPHRGFIAHAVGANHLAFLCIEAKDNGAALAIYQQEHWQQFRADFSEFMYRMRDGTMLVAERTAFHIWDRDGSAEIGLVHLPAGELLKTVVQGGDGSYWIGTIRNVLHYQPAPEFPRTRIMPVETNVPCHGVLHVAFSGVRSFSSSHQPASYQFSWRFDNETWLPFQKAPNGLLSVARLRPGVHRLDVRARDATGKTDPRGQGFYFTILSIPLQNRDWFMPVVAGMALLLVYLSLKEILRLRQLAQTNERLQHAIQSHIRTQAVLQEARDELELRVAERTAELSRSLQSLTKQVAERQRAESATAKLGAQLRQAQKMEAIGTLAGGIAHDFNNILAVILPSAHLALKEAGGHPMLQKSLTRIVNSAERARNLVKQILAFGRLQQQERQTVNLESLVKESMKLLRAALPSTIEIVIDCQPNLPVVLADPTQIHQVIMNLCSNAEHAMRGRVGRLDIRLESLAATESASCPLDLAPGFYVKLSVSDTGFGMDDATLKRIFDPFFTTKTPQEGTGLGLAVVHGIIKDHGGTIHVRSQVGQGTTFDLFIPAQPAPAGSLVEVAVPIRQVPQGQGEHILFVDDETGVCETAQAMLEQYGYKVTAFTNPLDALAEFQAVPDSFNLVFTDLTMPGMTGVDLGLNILEIRRDIPVILATGFGGAWKAETARRLGIRDVVLKPISPESYGLIVAQALHPKQAG